jgi:hypothetical protein
MRLAYLVLDPEALEHSLKFPCHRRSCMRLEMISDPIGQEHDVMYLRELDDVKKKR